MEKKKLLFRKQSLEGISSPEQLDDYLKVTNPGLWVILIAPLFLLIGILGFFLVEESPVRNPDSLGYLSTILYGFRPDVVRKNAVLVCLWYDDI